MVDEFLSEREQAEQVKVWLRENWVWLVAAVALVVGGFYGRQWWDARQDSRSVAAEQRFTAMLDALAGEQREEGVRIAGEITDEFADTPYADHATLVLARLDVEGGDLGSARLRLAQVMDGSEDAELRLVARLRLARVQLAEGRHEEALATLDGATEGSVEPRIQELRGDVMLARGDRKAALDAYRRAQAAAGDGSGGSGLVDPQFLSLKIDELAAAEATE